MANNEYWAWRWLNMRSPLWSFEWFMYKTFPPSHVQQWLKNMSPPTLESFKRVFLLSNMVKRTLEFIQLGIYILFKVLHVIGICMGPGMPKTWTSSFFFFFFFFLLSISSFWFPWKDVSFSKNPRSNLFLSYLFELGVQSKGQSRYQPQ